MIALILLAGLAVCVAAYVYGYMLHPKAFRPMPVVAFCATILALFQIVLFFDPRGAGQIHVQYAAVFLVIAGLAQAVMAVQGRRWRERRAAGPETGT